LPTENIIELQRGFTYFTVHVFGEFGGFGKAAIEIVNEVGKPGIRFFDSVDALYTHLFH
jgi:hypothetical protein